MNLKWKGDLPTDTPLMLDIIKSELKARIAKGAESPLLFLQKKKWNRQNLYSIISKIQSSPPLNFWLDLLLKRRGRTRRNKKGNAK